MHAVGAALRQWAAALRQSRDVARQILGERQEPAALLEFRARDSRWS